MSISKNNYPLRCAILEEHGRKCIHCNSPLKLSNFEVEHILPEALLKDSIENRKSIFSGLGLPLEFDVNSLDNLVPSCRDCNKKKSALILPNAAILIAIAKGKRERIEMLIQKYSKEGSRDKLLEKIILGIAKSHATPADIVNFLKMHSPDRKIHDIYNLGEEFSVGINGIEELLNRKIGELQLFKSPSPPITVSTLNEYRKAIEEGYKANCNANFKQAKIQFDNPLAICVALLDSYTPQNTEIQRPRRGISDLENLPAKFFFERICSFQNINNVLDLINSKQVESKILSIGSERLQIVVDDWETTLLEVARADFSGKGFEEILFVYWGRPTKGTLLDTDAYIASYDTNLSMFEFKICRWSKIHIW